MRDGKFSEVMAHRAVHTFAEDMIVMPAGRVAIVFRRAVAVARRALLVHAVVDIDGSGIPVRRLGRRRLGRVPLRLIAVLSSRSAVAADL